MSTPRVLRSSSTVPSTSATEISSKRTLSDAENDADADSEVPQPKRARSTAPDASTDAREKKRRRGKKKQRKTPVVAVMPASANRDVRERAQTHIDAKPRSVSAVASSSRARDTEASATPVPVPAPLQPSPSTSAPAGTDVIAVKDTKVSESIIVEETPVITEDTPDPVLSTPQSDSGPSTSFDKGKNKAPDQDTTMVSEMGSSSNIPVALDESLPLVVASTPDANAELLAKHNTLLATLTQSLTCQICLNSLHKPYALAPCGHVACRDCLVAWFSAPAPDAQGQAPDRRPLPLRPKRCPHCRALVEARPAEVWVLKEITAALVKSGLATDSMSVLEPAAAVDEAPDPWDGIFAPPRSREAEERGVHDDEDGVWRCVDCFHEIWDSVCSGCERVYPGHHDEDIEGAEDALMAVIGDRIRRLDERLVDDDGGWGQAPGAWPHGNGQVGAAPPAYRPWWARAEVHLTDDEDDDDYVEGELGPFPAVPPRWRVDDWPPLDVDDEVEDDDDGGSDDEGWAPRVIEVSDDEEAYESDFIGDGEDEHGGGPEILEVGDGSDGEVQQINRGRPDIVELGSDSDDDVLHVPRRRRPIYVDDDDDDDELQILDGPAAPAMRRPILIGSDEEGDADDEHAAGIEYVGGAHFHDGRHDEEALFDPGYYDEDEGLDQLTHDDEEDEQGDIVEDDGSINRIPRHLARQFGRGARF